MNTSWMGYFFQGLGIFIGIVTGVVVTLIAQWFAQEQKEKETIKYLKFEIDLNVGKISQWLDEINNYRNAVNSDTLNIYSGYFDLSRVATSFYYNTFYSGLLYKYLDFESVNKLQIIFSELVLAWENLLNNQIAENKKVFEKKKASFDKLKVTQEIIFWETKFKAHKKTLEEVKKRFEKKSDISR